MALPLLAPRALQQFLTPSSRPNTHLRRNILLSQVPSPPPATLPATTPFPRLRTHNGRLIQRRPAQRRHTTQLGWDSRSRNPAINLYGSPLPAAATAGRSLASAQASVFPLPPTAFAPFNPSEGFASCAAPGFGSSESGPAGYPSSIGEASSRSGQQGCGGSSYLAPSPQVSRADPYSSNLPQRDRQSGSNAQPSLF
jgi:hypothetical protein